MAHVGVCVLKHSRLHSKKCWVVSNMDKPKCWVKNAIKNVIPTSTFTFSCTFFNYIFNPAFVFVHI